MRQGGLKWFGIYQLDQIGCSTAAVTGRLISTSRQCRLEILTCFIIPSSAPESAESCRSAVKVSKEVLTTAIKDGHR